MRRLENRVKLFVCALALMLLSMPTLSKAQEDDKFSMSLSLNSDIFFGYYPFFAGSYALSETTSFTFYGILWSGGTGGGWGNWTEFGVGMNFSPSEGLNITPQFGLLNGNLTSGLGTPRFGEGFVPNLTVTYSKSSIEGELYSGYYVGLDNDNANTNNYLHYWLTGGYVINSWISAGLHFEHLRFMGGKNYPSEAAYDFYMVAGPYIKFAAPSGKSYAKFTGAMDFRSDEQRTKSAYAAESFFKLTVGMSL